MGVPNPYPMLDEAGLVKRLCQALDIAKRAVALIAPGGYKDADQPDSEVSSEKVVAETAMLLLAATGVRENHDEVGMRVDELARLIIPYARSGQVRVQICMNPVLARDYAFAHTCLSRVGYVDATLDKLLAQSLSSSSRMRERLPHRDLEQEWLARMWNPEQVDCRENPDLPARSMLGHELNVFAASRDDVYAFTHALMYATDLGARSPRFPRPLHSLLEDADTSMARCLDENDYDLGGEVLLTWALLKQPWSPTARFGLIVLTRVEDEVGFLPAPITRVDRYFSLKEGEERSRYALATAYHTAYVMGLLCAVMLRPGNVVSTTVPLCPYRQGVASALLAFLHSTQKEHHWVDDFGRMDSQEQDSLAPFLQTVVLRRAFLQHNFLGMREILDVSLRFGLSDHVVVHQSVELIRRVSLLGT